MVQEFKGGQGGSRANAGASLLPESLPAIGRLTLPSEKDLNMASGSHQNPKAMLKTFLEAGVILPMTLGAALSCERLQVSWEG